MDIKKLKEREFVNVERNASIIASKLIEIDQVDEAKIIATAYLAYLVKKEELPNENELIKFIDQNLPDTQRYFLKDGTSDAYWKTTFEIAELLSLDALLSVVLWNSNTGEKFGAMNGTPNSIVKLAYEILNPKNDRLADFCSGEGVFLTFAASQNNDCSLYGVETNTQAKIISDIRLSFFSNETDIEQNSALEISEDKKFDKIFCNYPWGVQTRYLLEDEQRANFCADLIPELKKSTIADWYFIVNVIKHLSDKGKAVVLVSNATTRNSRMDRQVRERFIKSGFLEAVISFPANMFAPFSSIATSMLVLSKNNVDSIRFIDASELETIKMNKTQNVFTDETITSIINMLHTDSELSKRVEMEEIARNDYVINPLRYLQAEIKVKDGVPFADIIKNIKRGIQLRAAVMDEMISDTPTPYRYLKLADIQDGMISEELASLKEIGKKQEKYCLNNHSLVISKNISPLKVAVASIEDGQKILASGNLYIIELDETKANPYYVKAYLESEQGVAALSRINVGSVIPNISLEDLTNMLIPNPSIEIQNEFAEKYLIKMDEIKILKYRLQKATMTLKNMFEEE